MSRTISTYLCGAGRGEVYLNILNTVRVQNGVLKVEQTSKSTKSCTCFESSVRTSANRLTYIYTIKYEIENMFAENEVIDIKSETPELRVPQFTIFCLSYLAAYNYSIFSD